MRAPPTSRSAPAPRGCRTSIAGALLAAIVGGACSASIDTNLENKSCSAERECLPGWVCSRDNLCVERDDTGSSSSRSTGSTESGSSGETSGPRVSTQTGARAADGGVEATEGDELACDAGTSCEGRCVDVAIDPRNCGTCGQQCEQPLHGEAVCIDGMCQIACDPEHTKCDRKCVRLDQDPSHCGSCNNSCATPFGGRGVCDGSCDVECNPGLTLCGDTCVWLLVDAANCGTCGRVCPADEQCGGGECVGMCAAPSTQCDRSCVDLASDPIHCGECGNACTAPENQVGVCLAGECGAQCATGRTSCDGNCVDLQNDALNCGACGATCPQPPRATPYCSMGLCEIACEAGYEPCDGQCVSRSIVQTARQAGFGDLGVCAALAALQAGMCLQAEDARWCDRGCVNVRTDESHCGYCNRACDEGQSCWGGRCI